ncbi:hypothetical protein L596_014668 [Steinernema carpocapsae]|uniref:RING-type domain-containing protein n=1 Tax=Steinernema carpocapsae TaxID=34508 RepID=A0A4U5NDD7_STECR|nr:hypothetical protein L596_014668 [Steinernema carpocapsae]
MSKAAEEGEIEKFGEGECVLFTRQHEDHLTSRPGGFLSQFWEKFGLVTKVGDAGDVVRCAFFVSSGESVKKVGLKLNVRALQKATRIGFADESRAMFVRKGEIPEAVTIHTSQNPDELEVVKENGSRFHWSYADPNEGVVVPVYEQLGEAFKPLEAANQPNAIIEALEMQHSGRFVKMKPVMKNHIDQINKVSDGRTPLLFALENEMWQAARTLVSHGALASIKNPGGNNAYHLAVLANHSSLITEFSKKNLCGVNAKNAVGQRPFHVAIEKSYINCINALIACPLTDLNGRDAVGDTPLHLLVRKEPTKHVLAALERVLGDSSVDYAKRNREDVSMFEEAILCGHEKLVDLICRMAPGVLLLPDAEGNFPIHLTTREGKCQILHTILNYNIDAALSLNARAQTPLHLAVAKWGDDIQNHVDRLACIQNLVDMKLDLNLCDDNGETIGHYLGREAAKTDPPKDEVLKLLRRDEMWRSNVRLVDFAQAIWPHFHVAAFCYLVLMGLDLFAKDKKGFAVIDFFNNQPKLCALMEEYASKRSLQKAAAATSSDSNTCSRSCGGQKSNVRFIPCGHVVMCSDCALGTKLMRCSKCYSKITKAFRIDDGFEIPLNGPKTPIDQEDKESVAESGTPEDLKKRKKMLQEQLERLKAMITCRICEKRRVDTVLVQCGHVTCSNCSAPESLKKCHICSADIEKRVHMYR